MKQMNVWQISDALPSHSVKHHLARKWAYNAPNGLKSCLNLAYTLLDGPKTSSILS